MAKNPDFGINGLFVQWDTNRAHFVNSIDRTVAFLGMYWHISCSESRYERIYTISASVRGMDPGKCISTLIYIIHNGQECLRSIKSDILYNAASNLILWTCNEDEIAACIPEFYRNATFTVYCHFSVRPFSPLQTTQTTRNTETLIDSKLPLDSSIRNSPISTVPAKNFAKSSLDHSHDLESLSLDLGKLLKDEGFSDVKLKCGGHTISAHKAVLVARSEVFAAMFRHKMGERVTGVVDIADIDVQVLKLFLEYVYSGKVQGLTPDLLPSLYAAGDKYAVHTLKEKCMSQMVKGLTEGNCVSCLVLADTHNDAVFKKHVVSFICAHQTVFQSNYWLELSQCSLKLANEVYQSFITSRSNFFPKNPRAMTDLRRMEIFGSGIKME